MEVILEDLLNSKSVREALVQGQDSLNSENIREASIEGNSFIDDIIKKMKKKSKKVGIDIKNMLYKLNDKLRFTISSSEFDRSKSVLVLNNVRIGDVKKVLNELTVNVDVSESSDRQVILTIYYF